MAKRKATRKAKPKAKKRVRLSDLKVRKGGSANIRGGAPGKKGQTDAPRKDSQPTPTPTPSPTPTPTTTLTPS
jgi:hypothetical protein